MASLITHPIIPLTLAVALGRNIIPVRLALLGMALSMLPDLDSIGFLLGIPYDSPYGHRGFSHSIAAAVFCTTLLTPLALRFSKSIPTLFLFLFGSMLSHGLLDALTDNGRGVEFFWPFDQGRYFFPFHPIHASPVNVRRFLGERGIHVLGSELLWVWLPCLVVGLAGVSLRKVAGINSAVSEKH